MKKDAWLEVAESDLITSDKPELQTTLYVVRELLRCSSDKIDIEPTKTIEGAYQALREYAKEKQNAERIFTCSACDDMAFKVFSEYLGIEMPNSEVDVNNGIVNLEDFF